LAQLPISHLLVGLHAPLKRQHAVAPLGLLLFVDLQQLHLDQSSFIILERLSILDDDQENDGLHDEPEDEAENSEGVRGDLCSD